MVEGTRWASPVFRNGEAHPVIAHHSLQVKNFVEPPQRNGRFELLSIQHRGAFRPQRRQSAMTIPQRGGKPLRRDLMSYTRDAWLAESQVASEPFAPVTVVRVV